MANYDYFLVSSFEFTCDGQRSVEPQEIIEFCVYKYCLKTQSVEERFHSYVKPQHPVNGTISMFCKMLTCIDEGMLRSAPTLEEVLHEFDTWLWKQGLHQSRFIFVPYTHFDLQYMLPYQCKVMEYHCPAYFYTWLHLKEMHEDFSAIPTASKRPALKLIRRRNSQSLLNTFGVKQEGRLHCAIDNCTNTVNLIKTMSEKGVDFSTKVWTTLAEGTAQTPDLEDVLSGRSTPMDFFIK